MKSEEFTALANNLITETAGHIDYFTVENDADAGTTRLEVTFREKPKTTIAADFLAAYPSVSRYQGGIL